jgi:hypothetical protein
MSTDTCGRHVRTTGEGPLVPNVLNYFEFSNGLRPAPRLPRKRRFPDAARKAHRSRALSWGLLSLLRKAFVETAVLAALSLASNSVSWDRQRRRVADAVRLSGYGAERTRDYPLVLAPPPRQFGVQLRDFRPRRWVPRLIARRGLRAKIKQMTAMPSERIAMGPLVWKRHIPTLPATPCDRF